MILDVATSHLLSTSSTKFVDGCVWVDGARVQNAAGKIWLQRQNSVCLTDIAALKLTKENAQIGHIWLAEIYNFTFHAWPVCWFYLIVLFSLYILFDVKLQDYCTHWTGKYVGGILPQHFPRRSEGITKTTVRLPTLWTKIWTWDLSNMKQEM
jgi:hypothetical protein